LHAFLQTEVGPLYESARAYNNESGRHLSGSLAMNQHTGASNHSQSIVGAFSFGPFLLLPAQQLLLQEGTPVRIGSRALLILTALVENVGELVSKSELMARAWPNAVVEESNLKVHIAALRRALGDGQRGHRYLVTINGRGYSFVAPVEYSEQSVELSGELIGEPGAPSAQQGGPGQPACHLPVALTQPIGRADTVARLHEALSGHRLVTVLGPGGIGKTTVALCTAQACLHSYAGGARFVDLASIAGPGAFYTAIASALGLTLHRGDKLAPLVAHLQDRQMLIVLDTCEHVIEEAALFAEEVTRAAPNVVIMATSRQPLRASGEYLHRLPPLQSPPDAAGLTAAEALTFSAVRLFVERAAAGHQGYELNDEDAPIVAGICRSLDNIPLAIELVATRFDAFGLRGLSLLLNDGRRLLNQRRRTTLARHQTLGAALDWSYALLPEVERTILRRLSVCDGAFTLEAAAALAEDGEITPSDVIGGVVQLVEKSLLMADVSGTVTRYQLLHITRAYALQKLAESGELEAVAGKRSYLVAA
jgi:predicted ATPase/DNA-binding winged helix-turn-helix (wHTH) protein